MALMAGHQAFLEAMRQKAVGSDLLMLAHG